MAKIKRFLVAISEGLFTQPYNFLRDDIAYTEEGKKQRELYSSCFNSLVLTTRAIDRFVEMRRPDDSNERYLVIWGVLQAFVIQQDAVLGLHKLFVDPKTGKKGFVSDYVAWHELRTLRDTTAGHPTGNANILGTVSVSKWDWAVISRGTTVYPYILERISSYEKELLDATEKIATGISVRVAEVDSLRRSRYSG